jgi:hypothetical protein
MKKVSLALIIIIFLSSCMRQYTPWQAANYGKKAACNRKTIR